MAGTISEFLIRQREQAQASSIGAANVVLGSVEQKPDEIAANLQLADEFGKATGNPVPPLPMVTEYQGVFAQAVERAKNNTILSKAPVLTEWLRDPRNAGLARDTLPELAWWESGWQSTGNALSRGVMRLPQSYNQWLAQGAAQRAQDQQVGFGEILSDEMAIRDRDGNVIAQRPMVGPLDLFNAGTRLLTSRLAGVIGSDQQQQAAFYQQQAGDIAKRIAAIPMSEAGESYKREFVKLGQSGDVMADLGQFANSVAANPAGFLAFLTETAIESAPSIVAGVGVTAATRNPWAGGAAMGVYSGAQEMGVSPVEFFQENGVDVSTPEGAMAAITNPDLMRAAAERGAIRGLIIGAFDGLSGGMAGQALAKSPMGNLAVQAITQAFMGSAGEAGAQIAAGQQFNIAEVLLEGLAEFVTAPIEVAGVGGRAFIDGQKKAADAEARRVLFQELSGQATASVLRNRMPTAFQDFVAQATANGQVENVYVPASQFVTYFQGIGVDPNEIVAELGLSRDDLDVAIAGGGDLQIPTAVYAAKIAGSEHDAFLMENMRFDPDEFTSAEAAEFNARAQDAMAEAWEVAEALRVEQDELRSFEQEIYDTMVSRLRAAGRSTDVATTEAMLYPAFYRVMAERSDMTVQEFMTAYPLPQVQGELPQGIQYRDVDALNRTLAEARARKTAGLAKRGPSLLEFISERGGITDVGGELKARDAEIIRRGRGRKNLRLARAGFVAGMSDMFSREGRSQYGADSVAQAVIEAGYLADDPIVLEYQNAMREGREVPDITRALWDAIDRELRGEAQYVADREADVADEQTAALDQMEAYLNEIGVSLDDDDAAIKAAIEADQAGRQYGQGGGYVVNGVRYAVKPPKKLWRGTVEGQQASGATGLGTAMLGRGLYSSPDKSFAKMYGKVEEVSIEAAWPRNPLVLDGAGGGPALFNDWIFRTTNYKNIREFNKDWPDPAEFVKSRGYDGVIAGDEVVRYPDVAGARILYQPAYHGTPHLFDKFSTDRIGSGEGNQAFGWGLYFAGKKSVATYYRDKLSAVYRTEDEMQWGGKSAIKHYEDAERKSEYGKMLVLERIMLHQPKTEIEAYIRESLAEDSSDTQSKDALRYLNSLPSEAFPATGGRLLTVEIPDDADLLDWEKPIEKQSTQVKALLRGSGLWKEFKDNLSDFSSPQNSRGKGKGENLYAYLSWKLGSEQAASKRLLELGIPGHRYPAGTIANVSGGGHNYVIYDDTRVRVTTFEQQNRGSIQIPGGGVGNGDTIIRLFQSADLSTMVHESGHYFLTVMQDLAAKGEGQSVDNLNAVKSWWGENADAVAKDAMRVMPDTTVTADDVRLALDAGTTGDVMKDAAIDVGMQEQWARAFEAYLMEGKAPNAELRSAFEKFRAWLISIYQRLTGLNVTISDDLRQVFDRMLATDAEIAKAKAETGDTGPIFATAEQMGLADEEYARFLKLRSQGEDDAKARLMREIMEPVKREREKAYKAEKAKVRGLVEEEINRQPVYRAWEWMGNRRWLTGDQPEQLPDFRLSKDVLVERYGEGVLKTLPRGKQTIYAVDGGLDPDDAAGWFGFDSGDQMIRALERAPKRNEAIDAETERLMREMHGDPLNDGSVEAKALDAVHGDKRGQWLAAELKAVAEVAEIDVAMTAKEARETARQVVARMKVRDAMNANRFLSAERKAGEEATRLAQQLGRDGVWLNQARNRIGVQARKAAKGAASADTVATAIDAFNSRFETTETTYQVGEQQRTSSRGTEYTIPAGERTTTSLGYNDLVAKLADAKRRQLLNHALYMEARKVADEVEKAERFVAKLGKASHREKIAGAGRRENAQVDYLGAIDELLTRYDFRKTSGRADERRGALAAFVETMKAQGRENEIAIPDAVLSDAARRPYKTLPVEELRGVVDSLKNLEHIALRWDKLIDAQQERELSAAVDEIADAFEANLPKRPPGRVRTAGEGARNMTRQFLDLVLNAGTLLREIDGFADLGPAYRNIKQPIDDAMSRLIGRKEKAAADLEALYAVYSKDERRRMAVREELPGVGLSLSKWERIAVALNTGNAGNYQRLTDKRVRGGFSEAQVNAILATLDARDADFVQSVWDYVGTFKADIAARERRTTGVEPAWVDPSPVVIAGKTLRGGYYPLKYDPRLSSLARDDEANDLATSLQAGRFGKAQTRNGHLKERAQSSGRDVELDMSVLHRHVNQVIYDLELSEPVANAWRILHQDRIRSAFLDAGKQPDFDALEIWLKDVAEGEMKSADLIGRASRTLKSNFTAAKLAFNLSTVALQITGLSQTAVVVGKRDLAIGVQKSLRQGVEAEIVAKSPFMRTRQTTFNKDIFDMYNDPLTGPVMSRWDDFRNTIVGPVGFWLMTKVQWHIVDKPTWLAGYHQGLRKFGNDEVKAIAHADAIVKRAQASGLFSDRSAVERGSTSQKGRQQDWVRLFTALGSYMFAKFNVAYERSARARRTIGEEGVSLRSAQEALSWTVDMAFLFTLEALIMAMIKGNLPDGEDEEDDGWLKFLAKETGLSVMGTLPFIRDLAGPLQGYSGGGAYGSITGELTRPWQQIMQGEVDKALVKSVISATGLFTGLPATQINRAVDASWRQVDGEDVAPMEYLLGKPR